MLQLFIYWLFLSLSLSTCFEFQNNFFQTSFSKQIRHVFSTAISTRISPSNKLSMRFDWREARAKHYAGSEDEWQEQLRRNQNPLLDTAWAHELTVPEVGATLVQNPTYTFTDPEEEYLNGAVIFLVEHGASGSVGLLLNRPIIYTLSDVEVVQPDSPLANCPMYLGGADGKEGGISVLHRYKDMRGAKQIIPGVCFGAYISDVELLLNQGRVDMDDFKVFLQRKEWGPGELEQELGDRNNNGEGGMWWIAACSSEMTMKGCIQLPVPLWRETCRLLGGKYALIAREAYDDL